MHLKSTKMTIKQESFIEFFRENILNENLLNENLCYLLSFPKFFLFKVSKHWSPGNIIDFEFDDSLKDSGVQVAVRISYKAEYYDDFAIKFTKQSIKVERFTKYFDSEEKIVPSEIRYPNTTIDPHNTTDPLQDLPF